MQYAGIYSTYMFGRNALKFKFLQTAPSVFENQSSKHKYFSYSLSEL